ncbi:MAG: nodulation protein NfeD [Deltaproteobacteria bacterium]|nr:nodulation protein NfeD [Deltaproteobacteria bacterium]
MTMARRWRSLGLAALLSWLLLCGGRDGALAATPAAPTATPPPHPPAAAPAGRESSSGPVWVVELADTINPGTALYLVSSLERARAADAALVVITLDTPGGLVDSMRQMVQAVLASPLPVVVYVAPSGARATSAGAFLVLASPLAAMAPATHLGAAHPVGAGGEDIKGTMGEKVVSDLTAYAVSLAKKRGRNPELARAMVEKSTSYDAGEALKLGLVQILAPDLGTLLKDLEGRKVETAQGPVTVHVAGRPLRYDHPGLRERLLAVLANPNLAYILMMIGLAGLYFELSNPGAIFPGVVGAVSLILAFFALSTLPVSYAGLALILLAVVLFFAEIKVVSHGLLSLGGAVSLILGSLMLFNSSDELVAVSLAVLVPTVITIICFFAGVAYLAGRAQLAQSRTGVEGLFGLEGVALGEGRVKVQGEIWRAESSEPLTKGQRVVVKALRDLTLVVAPAPDRPGTTHKEG